jgi:hypothetical protein
MPATLSLYRQVLGDSWNQVAEPVRRMHASQSIVRAHGHLRIEHGRHRLARFLARLLRLPDPSPAAVTQLVVTTRPDGERWHRTFNGRRFDTRQSTASRSELIERFGALELRFHLDASNGSLVYVQRDAALRVGFVRVPLPRAWAPRVQAREDPAGPKRIKVDVRIALPSLGPLITYDGFIDVEDVEP